MQCALIPGRHTLIMQPAGGAGFLEGVRSCIFVRPATEPYSKAYRSSGLRSLTLHR
jgi:hypothetical protein